MVKTAVTDVLSRVLGAYIDGDTSIEFIRRKAKDLISVYKAGKGAQYSAVASAKYNRINMIETQLKSANINNDEILAGFRNAVYNGKLSKIQARAIAQNEKAFDIFVKATGGKLDLKSTIDDMIDAAGFVAGFNITGDNSPYYDRGVSEVVESDTLVPKSEVGIYDNETGRIILNKNASADKKLAYVLAHNMLGSDEKISVNKNSDEQFSIREKYWHTGFSKTEYNELVKIAKIELGKSTGYIDNDTKWLYNNQRGKSYFALYSTTDVDNPTILYASKDATAQNENQWFEKFIAKKELLENGRNDLRRRIINRVLTSFGYELGQGGIYSRVNANNRSNDGNVRLYSKSSGIRPSQALLNCLGNIAEREKRIGTTQYSDRDTLDKLEGVKKGKLHFDGDLNTLNDIQRASLSLLEQYADVLDVDVYIEDDIKSGKNGWFNGTDNSIHVDINAGNDARGLLMYTAAHEMTHFIEKWSKEKYNTLSNFVLDNFIKNDVSVGKLITAQQNKAAKFGIKLTPEQARREVVADACESMLLDESALQKLSELRKQDQTLFERIKYFIVNLVGKVKALYNKYQGNSVEGSYISQMSDAATELQNLFNDSLYDAGYNYQNNNISDTDDNTIQYSRYSEFYSLALRWSHSFDRKNGDITIINSKGRFVLIEANDNTEDGYRIIRHGNYEEVSTEYERLHSEENTSIHEDIGQIRSEQRTGLWDLQHAGYRRYASGNGEQTRGEEFRTDAAGDDEYLRSGDRETSELTDDIYYSLKENNTVTGTNSFTDIVLDYMLQFNYDMQEVYAKAVKKLNSYIMQHRERLEAVLSCRRENGLTTDAISIILQHEF